MSLSPLNIEELAEGCQLEVKKASGRDGQGEVPRSFFESYSAMANTYGGVILLGVDEKLKGKFIATGIGNPSKVIKLLWDDLNNRQIVSINLLNDNMVNEIKVDNTTIIRIKIPRAQRGHRPVYIGQDPFKGTYRRNYEGDYLCDRETVKRMIAEQVEDVRDAQILERYGFDDIDENTFKAYRNQFKATKPDHPWLDLDDKEFLRSIGGWKLNRETNTESLTIAGLLMFGKLPSILDIVPNYILDYQEHSRDKSEARWIDRLTTDGIWSGNLYDFYKRVIHKLFSELKVPFKLQSTQRVDETSVHEALREALINTLIHADYTGRVSILVVKRPDMFEFRNPGTMRLSIEDALKGGNSDCRNRNLQKMFQLVGLGEQAGSGIPKIYSNWKKQHWKLPELTERIEPDQTILSMQMISLLPEEALRELDERFGESFSELSEVERLALVTVTIEGKVTNDRLKCVTVEHPHELTKILSGLVKKGFLESDGATRGTYYFFPGEPPDIEFNLVEPSFDHLPPSSDHLTPSSDHLTPSSDHLTPSSDHLTPSSDHLPPSSDHLTPSSDHLTPSSDHLTPSSDHIESLKAIAAPVRVKSKAEPELMKEVILKICQGRYLTQQQLAEILNRSINTLRPNYLKKMVKEGLLELLYPDKPTHPDQAYRTREQN
jgi:ATP-dependent DNA helicase RecG